MKSRYRNNDSCRIFPNVTDFLFLTFLKICRNKWENISRLVSQRFNHRDVPAVVGPSPFGGTRVAERRRRLHNVMVQKNFRNNNQYETV